MRTKKIVIADDFHAIRKIVKSTLAKREYDVLEATNGDEALKYFDGTTIDLLITDYDMPNYDGAKLIRRMRNMSQYTYTPVIMLTGVSKEKIKDKIKDLNIACFLNKPFEVKNFYSIIEKLI